MLYLLGCADTMERSRYEFNKDDTLIKNKIGYLQVYTCKLREKPDYQVNHVFDLFKGCTIYSKRGDFVKNIGKSYKNPPLVRLEEGEYIVVGELQKNSINSLHIKIEEGKVLQIGAARLKIK